MTAVVTTTRVGFSVVVARSARARASHPSSSAARAVTLAAARFGSKATAAASARACGGRIIGTIGRAASSSSRDASTSAGRGVGASSSSDGEDGFAGFLPNAPSAPPTPKRPQPGKGKRTPQLRFDGDTYKTPAARRRERDEGERLNKALASLGVASRRGADDLIFGGRVKVNGTTITAPQTKVNLNTDVVMVDGKVVEGGVSFVKEHTYFMLNKPKGFVCSARPGSESGKTVLDLFEQWREEFRSEYPGKLPPRLFTVGRLDVATTGLLLVTTDGDWSQRVSHPSSEVVKQYVVTANAKPTRAQIVAMSKGTEVDGAHVVPVRVEVAGADGGPKNRIIVEVVDGRNREVRVLCESAGVEVKNLKRTRVGGLRMPKELPLGKYVRLKPAQIAHVLDKGLAINGGTF
ncbi:pseudouridine synthase [Ostreococcus tauri]|uniref:Pseudouridine synthase n=1 Tax=Ostreococcus tauri TaxID=70448 RepID=A0A1Y5IF85_OSTTA|nr:pseudouridine synthase [Ostreococcus tauri]